MHARTAIKGHRNRNRAKETIREEKRGEKGRSSGGRGRRRDEKRGEMKEEKRGKRRRDEITVHQ